MVSVKEKLVCFVDKYIICVGKMWDIVGVVRGVEIW